MINWNTPSLQTNTQPKIDVNALIRKVFEDPWMIHTRVKWCIRDVDINHYGIPTSNDIRYDEEMYDQWTKTVRTIAELAEFYDQGKEFIFVDVTDIERVFGIITEYTDYVAYRLNHDVDLNYTNIESNESVKEVLNDIVKLQNLGNHIYPVMQSYTPQQVETEGLLGFLNERGMRYGIHCLDFNPYKRFGFNNANVDKSITVDKPTDGASQEAIRIQRALDMSTLSRIRAMI